MATARTTDVESEDSGYAFLAGRHILPNDDIRKLQGNIKRLKFDLEYARKQLKEALANWRKDNEKSKRQISQFSKKNELLKVELQLSVENKENEKTKLQAEYDQMSTALIAKDIDLEETRTRLKHLEKLAKDYEMALKKAEENNRQLQSSAEFGELNKECLASKEEVQFLQSMLDEFESQIAVKVENATRATHNKLEAMDAKFTDMDAKFTQMMSMMMNKLSVLDVAPCRHNCINSIEDASNVMDDNCHRELCYICLKRLTGSQTCYVHASAQNPN